MAVDIDLVLLGNERSLEPAHEWDDDWVIPSGMTVRQTAGGEPYTDIPGYDRDNWRDFALNHRANPINLNWKRPGDVLYRWWSNSSHMGMGELKEYTGGITTSERNDIDRCEVCGLKPEEGHTRCIDHPMSVFDSYGKMHDYPNIKWVDLDVSYLLYSDEDLAALNEREVLSVS